MTLLVFFLSLHQVPMDNSPMRQGHSNSSENTSLESGSVAGIRRWIFCLNILLCLIALSLSLVRPIGDPDLGWHLAAGRIALAQGAVPKVDHWNTFAQGKPWVAYSWLQEIVYASVEQNFGWVGLVCLAALLGVVLTASAFMLFFFLSESAVIALLLSALTVAGCRDYFDLRPQSFTWALFGLAMLGGYFHGAKPSKKSLLFFGFVCFLWANSHLTTVFAFIAAAAWGFTRSKPKQLILLLFAGFLGTLLTPHFGKEWIIAFQKAHHPVLYSLITEFQPASLWHSSAAISLLALIVLGLLLKEHSTSLPLRLFLASIGFTLLGFAIQKFIPYATIWTCASLAFLFAALRTKSEGQLSQGLLLIHTKLEKVFYRFGLLISLPLLFLSGLHFSKVLAHPIDRSSFPVAAMDFIRQNRLPGPILNDFSDGGYVLYRYLHPDGTTEMTVPLDGRTNVNDPKIMGQYINTIFGNTRWQEYVNSVHPNLVIWRNRYALPSILLASGDWCRLYSDETEKSPSRGWSVFVKKGAHAFCP